MLGFSLTEIILLAIIALVVIGPKQLPEVARNLGRLLNELKRTSNAFTREFRDNMDRANPNKPDPDPYPYPEMPAVKHTEDMAHVEPAPGFKEEAPPQFPLETTHDHVDPATVAKKENDPS